MIESYVWKKKRTPKFVGSSRINIEREDEVLTGAIDEKPASAPEERLANATARLAGRAFRFALGYPGEPGWKELDFLFNRLGSFTAVEVDGEFAHKGEILTQDLDDLVRLDGLRKLGIDVSEIKHIPAEDLDTKEMAERVARELFI